MRLHATLDWKELSKRRSALVPCQAAIAEFTLGPARVAKDLCAIEAMKADLLADITFAQTGALIPAQAQANQARAEQ